MHSITFFFGFVFQMRIHFFSRISGTPGDNEFNEQPATIEVLRKVFV